MQSLSTVLSALQPPTQELVQKNAISRTLQRGLTAAGGKMTSVELQSAATPHRQPLTQEVSSSVLSRVHLLNSSTKRADILATCTPDQLIVYRKLLIETIRPADRRLTMILLSQLMAEKPFFDADQSQVKYRLQQLATDLETYPYLAGYRRDPDNLGTQRVSGDS